MKTINVHRLVAALIMVTGLVMGAGCGHKKAATGAQGANNAPPPPREIQALRAMQQNGPAKK